MINKIIKKRRKPPRYLEAIQQAKVIGWKEDMIMHSVTTKLYPDLDLLHCSLNGVPLTSAQAKRAKAQGMRAGILDLSLPVPCGTYYGFYCEMKSADGRLSEDQKDVSQRLAKLGYKVVVCYSAEEAIEAIKSYYGERG